MNYIKYMGKWPTLFFYFLLLFLFAIYSYSQIDPNLTLLNHPLWGIFRNAMVELGYFNRPLSSALYLIFIAGLFGFHFYFLKNYKKINIWHLVLPLGIFAVFTYPFLSHDLFNYMFDAKIFTVYQQNPYLHKALDFPQDPWLRFMHWVHRPYPYGPTFLPITLIPSFLAMGKLLANLFFFKLAFYAFYVLGVWALLKIDKKYAVFFATNPYVLVEGLMNAHNDLVQLGIALLGVYLLGRNDLQARILFLISAAIKYLSAPLILLMKDKKSLLFKVALAGQIAVLAYLSLTQEVQQWYFLALFVFLPFLDKFVYRLNIFFAGLLLSYLPFIAFGGWDIGNLIIKHNIIWVSLGVFLLSYLPLFKFKKLSKLLSNL